MKIGINIYCRYLGKEESAPKIQGWDIQDYDRSTDKYRFHYRNAQQENLLDLIDKLSEDGHCVTAYMFANYECEYSAESWCSAATIQAQDGALCRNPPEDYQGDPDLSVVDFDKPLRMQSGEPRSVMLVGWQHKVFVRRLGNYLATWRPGVQVGKVIYNNTDEARYVRLLIEPQESFLSEVSVIKYPIESSDNLHWDWNGLWFSEQPEAPAALFVDRLGTGIQGTHHSYFLSKKAASNVRARFPGVLIDPVLWTGSKEGGALYNVARKLKAMILEQGLGQ